jgi:hypothetical protein
MAGKNKDPQTGTGGPDFGNVPVAGVGVGGGTTKGGGGGEGKTPDTSTGRNLTPTVKDPTYTPPRVPVARPPAGDPVNTNPRGPKDETPIMPRWNWDDQFKETKASERSLVFNANGAFHPIIYGTVGNFAPNIAYWKVMTGGGLLVRYIIGYGPINSVSDIMLDGKPIASWGLSIIAHAYAGGTLNTGYEVFLGTNNQVVSKLFTWHRAGWVQSRFPGVASIVIAFPPPTEGYSNPDPTKLTCKVEGLLVRDPAQDITLANRYFSKNNALHIADLITSKRYGGRQPDERINWDRLKDDTCPYLDAVISGSIKRYENFHVFEKENDINEAIENMRGHSQLFLSYNNGKIDIIADKPRTATGIHFTDEHILEGASFHVNGDSEVYNRIEVTYTDSADEWKEKVKENEEPGLGNSTYPPVNAAKFSLLGTPFEQQANRISYYLLNRSKLDKVFNFRTLQIGTKPLPGDRIKVTSTELNVTATDMVVTECEPEDGTWRFTTELYSEAIFTDAILTQIITAAPAVSSPHDTPPAPTGLVLTEEYDASSRSARIKISFTPASLPYTGGFTRIRARKTLNGVTSLWFNVVDTTGNVAYIESTDRAFYEFELKTVTSPPWNVHSAALLGSIQAVGKSTLPNNVVAIFGSQRENRIYLRWVASKDLDISYYKLRYGKPTDTWETAQDLALTENLDFSFQPDKLGTQRYFVKAVDVFNNESTAAVYADITAFYYGIGTLQESSLPFGPMTANAYGDTAVYGFPGLSSLAIVEGITVKGKMTIMNTRAISPSEADSEISTFSSANIQAWETNWDSPKRGGQGIWAPLLQSPPPSLEVSTTLALLGIDVQGSANGWRNSELKFSMDNAERIGLTGAGINTHTVMKVYNSNSVNPNIPNDMSISPVQLPASPQYHKFYLQFITNSAHAQVIYRPLWSSGVKYSINQNFPKVFGPTDVVTDVNGEATITYPTAMFTDFLGTQQVPYLIIQTINSSSVAVTITVLNSTQCTVKAFNTVTGAVASGITLRITGEDRGAGGSLSILSS